MTRRSGSWAGIGAAALAALASLGAGGVQAADTLDIYFVNVGRSDGSFTVTNSRNGFSKHYTRRTEP
jgi:hypothetical protein